MNAYPLELPLSSLSPARRVYIVRRGMVFLYPAAIVRDIANDRYTMDDDRPWSANDDAWECGRIASTFPGLVAVCRFVWKTRCEAPSLFDVWLDSVNQDADPEWIGAAAAVAARELMTFSLFKHRHLVDLPDIGA